VRSATASHGVPVGTREPFDFGKHATKDEAAADAEILNVKRAVPILALVIHEFHPGAGRGGLSAHRFGPTWCASEVMIQLRTLEAVRATPLRASCLPWA
jgi:hypothetical protein